jgi:hypothetical protein
MTNGSNGAPGSHVLEDLRRTTTRRWQALPDAIHAAFDCSKHVGVAEALTALAVRQSWPEGTIEPACQSEHGTLVATVWHDGIERDADGSLTYWIDAYCWRPDRATTPPDDAGSLRGMLQQHVARDVYVLLLKRGWDDKGSPIVECIAPDIVMWTLETAGQQWFVLRRPTVRRSDAKRVSSLRPRD